MLDFYSVLNAPTGKLKNAINSWKVIQNLQTILST